MGYLVEDLVARGSTLIGLRRISIFYTLKKTISRLWKQKVMNRPFIQWLISKFQDLNTSHFLFFQMKDFISREKLLLRRS